MQSYTWRGTATRYKLWLSRRFAAQDFIRVLFVILTSYFDESGTHAGSSVTIMGGIMANRDQWLRYQVRLDRLRHRYGFRVFHAKEFKSLTGQFSGWSHEKCKAFLRDFHATGADLMEGVTCAISNGAFQREYRGGEAPRKLRLDTKYGLCFRNCLVHLTAEAVRRLGSSKRFGETAMHVVLRAVQRSRLGLVSPKCNTLMQTATG
jgi:hypothetical protein